MGESHRDRIKCIGKCTHGVLLEARGLDCSIFDGKGAGNFSSSSTIDNAIVSDQISNNAKGIMKRSFRLIDDL